MRPRDGSRTTFSEIGITGTPTFILGDQMLVGAVGLEQMQKAVSTAME